jgi:hypothetical protein
MPLNALHNKIGPMIGFDFLILPIESQKVNADAGFRLTDRYLELKRNIWDIVEEEVKASMRGWKVIISSSSIRPLILLLWHKFA